MGALMVARGRVSSDSSSEEGAVLVTMPYVAYLCGGGANPGNGGKDFKPLRSPETCIETQEKNNNQYNQVAYHSTALQADPSSTRKTVQTVQQMYWSAEGPGFCQASFACQSSGFA